MLLGQNLGSGFRKLTCKGMWFCAKFSGSKLYIRAQIYKYTHTPPLIFGEMSLSKLYLESSTTYVCVYNLAHMVPEFRKIKMSTAMCLIYTKNLSLTSLLVHKECDQYSKWPCIMKYTASCPCLVTCIVSYKVTGTVNQVLHDPGDCGGIKLHGPELIPQTERLEPYELTPALSDHSELLSLPPL